MQASFEQYIHLLEDAPAVGRLGNLRVIITKQI